ncbi:MAG: hypothetical protein M1824_003090 [Vezdaea acicularis]|nr:MAG: hypothetical protein M1824_003090 [Vezdaea acicularis]
MENIWLSIFMTVFLHLHCLAAPTPLVNMPTREHAELLASFAVEHVPTFPTPAPAVDGPVLIPAIPSLPVLVQPTRLPPPVAKRDGLVVLTAQTHKAGVDRADGKIMSQNTDKTTSKSTGKSTDKSQARVDKDTVMVHEYKLQNFPMSEHTGPGRDEAKMGQLIANHNAVEWKRAEKIGGR